jgi:hypothetical protein
VGALRTTLAALVRGPLDAAAIICRQLDTRQAIIVEFYLSLAAAITVIRRLINRACTHYRSPHPAHHTPTPITINCRSLSVADVLHSRAGI